MYGGGLVKFGDSLVASDGGPTIPGAFRWCTVASGGGLVTSNNGPAISSGGLAGVR